MKWYLAHVGTVLGSRGVRHPIYRTARKLLAGQWLVHALSHEAQYVLLNHAEDADTHACSNPSCYRTVDHVLQEAPVPIAGQCGESYTLVF